MVTEATVVFSIWQFVLKHCEPSLHGKSDGTEHVSHADWVHGNTTPVEHADGGGAVGCGVGNGVGCGVGSRVGALVGDAVATANVEIPTHVLEIDIEPAVK